MKEKIFVFTLLVFLFNTTHAQNYTQTGIASFYANKFENKITASGEIYKHSLFTAAHKSLPFGTLVKVTNTANGKTVTVKINDRGPFVEDRIIDVSKSAAKELDFINEGLTQVKIEVVSNNEHNNTKNNKEVDSPQKDTSDSDTISERPTTPPNTQTTAKNMAVGQVATTYYHLKAEKTIPKGYGIQIASFQESANLIERVSVVEQELKQRVTVQVVSSNGAKIYRLIVGAFDTRAQAEYFKDSIKSNYQGFVVTF